MWNSRTVVYLACLLALGLGSPIAHAQWAVVDVGAIAQLVHEVAITEQSLAAAQGELQQAQQEFRSITGNRGMATLLSGIVRNYLPTGSGELQSLLSGNNSSFTALNVAMQNALTGGAVLTPQQLAALPPDAADHLQAGRRTAALLQAIAGTALTNASGRFPTLQQLIDAINSASDQKAALELNARIVAEQTMLQNEQTKLTTLYQALEAQHWSDEERAREQIVAAHGSFALRFTPAP
ncbi:MAG TPA: type IV secretion system protein [Steroidobacteraceae bacterium]|nr:type IV secretion system protein [Steroidobacteraceae bacterium]